MLFTSRGVWNRSVTDLLPVGAVFLCGWFSGRGAGRMTASVAESELCCVRLFPRICWRTALTNFPTLPQPLITVPQTDAPPAVDGRLDDPCWQRAARIEFLPRCADAEPAVDRTRTLLTYDADRLYLAFTWFAERRRYWR